jgi:hypothetical protein
MRPEYAQFLASKAPRAQAAGFEPGELPDHLFDFQAHCVEFCIRQGRAGLYLDTGLGKSFCQLEWSRQCAEQTNGRALILTPLAVAKQFEREGHRFGYDCRVIREQSEARDGINICNYDRLDKLSVDEFGAVSLDESSILKAFGGKTTQSLIGLFEHHRFRLSATATPAPNDHMELGNQAEFLGLMSAQEMLMRWFINDTSTASQQWRLKGYAEEDFWDWMASWSRLAQSPDDLGFDGTRFNLPPLNIVKHKTVGSKVKPLEGSLFAGDVSATNMFDMKRQTSRERAALAESLIKPDDTYWLIWCDTNDEEDALLDCLPGAVAVRGSMSIEMKEERLDAFVSGGRRILITKPSIGGRGLNLQHCHNMVYVGRTFSYEDWYQSVRRCWRFGQKKPVNVHIIVAEGEDQIGRVIDRKADDHAAMKVAMAAAMRRAAMRGSQQVRIPYNPQFEGRLPAWL